MPFVWRFADPPDLARQRELARSLSISELSARLLLNRGIGTKDDAARFLAPGLSTLSDPMKLDGMERAVDRVLAALKKKERIVVYGDSDVDGVSGTALLASFLRAVGGDVHTYIPNRLEEGYSLTERGLATLKELGAKVVLTVDNGTSAVDAISRLQDDGVDVIVVDHHEPPKDPPRPHAFLNPKRAGSDYPFPHLCGTGVAFQFLSALAVKLPASPLREDAIARLLRHCVGYVALATICDCVPLVGENRVLARAGLTALSATDHPGLTALRGVAGITGEVTADDVSFRLGPRINAAGRLGQADRALALLLADDAESARDAARDLDGKNLARQELEAAILHDARAKAAAEPKDARVLVLADERWHAGVVGIVANRIALESNKPAVLIALSGRRSRGSGRSSPGFDLFRLLSSCSEHLTSFGGHAFAAGLEIDAARLPAFKQAVLEHASRDVDRSGETRELTIDAEIPLGACTPSLMHELNRLAPFGEGNRLPMFAVSELVLDAPPRVVGRNANHLSFTVNQHGAKKRAIAYAMANRAAEVGGAGKFALAFTPRLNVFRGRADVDLEVKDIRRAE